MNEYLLIVRNQIHMGRPVTDDDLRALGCYREIPFYCKDNKIDDVEIIDAAYERFCLGHPQFRYVESVELRQLS